MADKQKYIHTVSYVKKDGTKVTKKYDWSKYPEYHCETCRKTIGYHSKSKHLKSVNHLRLEKLIKELELLKITQETQTQPNEPQNN